MPTSDAQFDRKRTQVILNDLQRYTKSNETYVRIESKSSPGAKVAGVSTRAGLVELGVELVRIGMLDNDAITVEIDSKGFVNSGNQGLIEFTIVDESVIPDDRKNRSSRYGQFAIIGGILGALLVIGLFVSTVIGCVTIARWAFRLT